MRIPNPRRHRRPNQSQPAFTLIEMVAVLVISSLVAASAVLSVRPVVAAARQASSIQRIRSIDQTLREQCSRARKMKELAVISLRQLQVHDEASQPGRIVDDGLPILRVLTPVSESAGQQIFVRYSPDGSSATFALEIGPSAVKSRYLVFVGGSGQVLEFDNESAVEDLFDAFRGK